MSSEYIEEWKEEAADFFEDFWEHLNRKQPKKIFKKKIIVLNGLSVTVRPAYLFAERIDNLLKVLFGASIAVSAVTASFLGFTSLSDFLNILMFTLLGRTVMFIIGISYLTIALWKLLHLDGRR